MVQLPATAAIEYVAACWGSFGRGDFFPGVLLSGGLMPVPPKFNAYTYRLGFLCPVYRSVTDKKTDKLGLLAPRGVDPLLPKFSGYVEVEAHYIFHPSTIWVRPLFTELGPKKVPKSRFCHEANEYMTT